MDPIRLTDTPVDAGPHGEGIVEYLPEDNALGFIPSQLLDPRHRLCVNLVAYGIVPRPGTVIPIIGATTPQQLRTNLGAAGLTLSEEVLADIEAVRRKHPMPF